MSLNPVAKSAVSLSPVPGLIPATRRPTTTLGDELDSDEELERVTR